MTRGDKIRNMTNEQLVDTIFENGIDSNIDFCQNKTECGEDYKDGIPEEMCRKCLLEWLGGNADTNQDETLDKLRITVEAFYEIKDAELYGGIGSIGYASSKIEVKRLVSENQLKEYIKKQISGFSQLCNVEVEKFRLITSEEYEENTEDEEELKEKDT